MAFERHTLLSLDFFCKESMNVRRQTLSHNRTVLFFSEEVGNWPSMCFCCKVPQRVASCKCSISFVSSENYVHCSGSQVALIWTGWECPHVWEVKYWKKLWLVIQGRNRRHKGNGTLSPVIVYISTLKKTSRYTKNLLTLCAGINPLVGVWVGS